MEHRKLPHGNEEIAVLGIGTGSLGEADPIEIEKAISLAIDNGINFFDLCGGNFSVFEPIGNAVKGRREKVYFQLHLGAVYDNTGAYGWSRNLDKIKDTLKRELTLLQTDYIDFGFLHCIDDFNDIEAIIRNGILDYAKQLKEEGVFKHLGFSSHTPEVAEKLLDLGIFDIMMFSINPAFDFEKAEEGDYGFGSRRSRINLFQRCQREGVAISVMKPFNGGRLLDASTSPFKKALTKEQCLSYILDRPGVIVAVPGVRNSEDVKELLRFEEASAEEKDYSKIGETAPDQMLGTCIYCNHCQPCPSRIDIALVNKYYDLALSGDEIARGHYEKLTIKADSCIQCGHCNRHCPFKVDQMKRMRIIKDYFSR